MIKIGITGSIASGKTTASKIISKGRGPIFSADKVVQELYQTRRFKNLIYKTFKINNKNQTKKYLRKFIFENKNNLKKLEKIIHPLVRKQMIRFTLQNKHKKKLFYEIPLLIESKLTNYFNVIILIKSKKSIRLRRFKSKNRNIKLFEYLNKKQISVNKKVKFCDHVVVNEKNLKFLKKSLLDIIKNYE